MKKNRFICFLLVLLAIATLIISSLTHPIVSADDYTYDYTVGFNSDSKNTTETEIKVSSSFQYLNLYVKNNSNTTSSFKVRYKTMDGNLLASNGDYSSFDLTSTYSNLSSGNYENKSFILNIKNKPQISIGDGEYYFYIVIYNVNDKDVIDSSKDTATVKIIVEPEYNFESTKIDDNKYGYVISELQSEDNASKVSTASLLGENKIDINKGSSVTWNFNVKNNLSKLYDTGLVDAYVGITGSFSNSIYSTANGWLKTNLYQNSSDYNKSNAVYNSNFYTGNSFGWDNIFPGSDLQGDMKNTTDRSSGGSGYNTTIKNGTRIYRNNSQIAYFKVDNPNKDLYFNLYNSSNNSMGGEYEAKNWYYNTFVMDSKTPTINKTYILDNLSSATNTSKIKLCVEFSEPVQLINSSNSTIDAYLNTNSLGYTTLSLKYVSGAGTTRLIYELDGDYPASTFSTKINRIMFSNTTIRDFSYNAYYKNSTGGALSVNNCDLTNSFVCNLDFTVDTRKSDVTITKSVTSEAAAMQTNDLTIKILNTSSGFSFRYALIKKGSEVKEEDLIELTDFKLNGDSSSTDSYWYYILTLGYELNGEYEFYYEVTSSYGITLNNLNEKVSLRFDNTAPAIRDFTAEVAKVDSKDDYTKYNFTFTLLDEPFGKLNDLSRIETLRFAYSESPLANNNNVSYINLINNPQVALTFNDENISFTISASLIGVDGTNVLYKDLHVGIVATDVANNSFTLSDTTDEYIRFDTRDILDGTGKIDGTKFNNLDDVYLIQTTKKPTLTFTHEAASTVGVTSYDYQILKYVDQTFIDITNEDLYKDYFEVTLSKDSKTYTIKFNNSGYYKVQFNVNNTLFSDTFEFYCVTGVDQTNNYSTVQYSVNKVYSTNSNRFYYYDNGVISSEYYNYDSVNNTYKNQMFSSEYLRNEYLKYYEYSDLAAIKITQDQATSLNSNVSSTYKKAVGETKIAFSGQIWIRYKRSDWSFSTSTTDWVYYYYGDYSNDTINVSYLSNNTNLKNAIEAVVSTIAKNCGSAIYLVDDGSGDGITSLDKDQVHTARETLSNTRNGNTIINAYFAGDTTLYDSVYTEDDVTYYIYSNRTFKFNDYTRLYIKNLSEANPSYTPIPSTYAGYEVKSILRSLYNRDSVDGKYELLEIDELGASTTKIYVISTAPNINISYETSEHTSSIDKTITQQNNGESYRFSTLTLKGFASSGAYTDPYQYILVKNSSTLDYVVYYSGDFQTFKTLTDGTYTIIISDRFENTYSINVIIDSTDTDFTLTKVDNEYVRFTCPLDTSSVFSFEVKFNGLVISTSYSQTLTFKDSGLYEFTLVDQNQKTVTKTIELTREVPSVTWRINDGEYSEINDSTEGAIIEKTSNSLYYIYTNKLLTFSYSGDYTFEFTGNPNYSQSLVMSQTRVDILSTGSYSVKIAYEEFSYNYVTYVIVYDTSNPDIQATSITNNVVLNDEEAQIKGPSSIDDKISDIGFTPKGTTSVYNILNNGQVFSNNINITVSDSSNLKRIEIYLNDVLLAVNNNINSNEYTYTITDKGSYKIVAKDILGNTSEFNFDNEQPSLYQEYLDSEPQTTNLDLDNAYSTVKYAHSNITYRMNNFDVFAIKYNNNVYYITLNTTDIYMYYLKTVNNIDNTLSFTREMIANVDLEDKTLKKIESNLEGIDLYARYDGTYLYLEINNVSSEVKNILTRLTSDYTDVPFYSNVELYNEKARLDFVDLSNDSIVFESNEEKFNKSFKISSTIDTNITEITYAYSENKDVEEFTTLDLSKVSDITFGEKNGYYYINVKNKYNNITKYVIEINKDLDVSINITLKDETTINYKYAGDTYYYSNNSAQIYVYNLDAKISVTASDSSAVLITKDENNGYYTFILDKSLEYRILISDDYKNTRNFTLKISEKEFVVDNDILTGFNDKALRKDELYTNQKLSLSYEKINLYGVYYISYRYYNSDKEVVVFDKMINDNPLVDLSNLIGNDGNGSYYLTLRDEYGNICIKEIHYEGSSVFSIYKKILTSDEYNQININDDGTVYSNDILEFRTDATKYKFTIDGKEYNLTYVLKFHEASLTGEYKYEIIYIDEYGYEYCFKAVLIRQEISSDISEETTELDGISYVTKDFSINFSDNYSAKYTLNNKEFSYLPNSMLHEDGLYTFVITDKAGNLTTINIYKDSVVSFTAYERDTNRTIVLGDVSSNGNVTFKASRDGEYITVKKAYLNGVLKENQETVFTDNGKWEVLLTDEIGNVAYFSFYIYTHVLSEFTYDTPYNYLITRIDYTNASGTKISYLDRVIQYDSYSHVTLSDNGTYEVTMTSNADRSIITFSIQINDEKPNVSLVGVENNGTTSDDVTIKGYQVGDVIRIYKDNSLIRTINVITSDMSSPVISELGDYRIEVTNTQGNTTVLEFKRQYTANSASSILIIVVLVVISGALFAGLFFRKREKID